MMQGELYSRPAESDVAIQAEMFAALFEQDAKKAPGNSELIALDVQV